MGFFSLIMSSLTSKFEGLISASMLTVVHQLVSKSRKALLIVVSCFVFAVLLSAGIIIMALEASAQYDTKGMFYFSALLTVATTLTLVSFGALVFILWPRSKPILPVAAFQASQSPPRPSSPLEDVLAVAINELMNYLKEKNKSSEPHVRPSP